jgi:hypothetical protein
MTIHEIRRSSFMLVFSALITLSSAPKVSAQSKSTGTVVFHGESAGKTGGHGSQEIEFSNFTSEDGVLVEQFVERYRTVNEAQRRLQGIGGRASKVVERGKKRGSGGRAIGERIRVVSSDSHGKALQIVAWIDGSKVFVLTSTSLKCVQEFERQFYP